MSDLIDRESAIVRATKVIKDDGVAHDVMEVLRDMPSTQPEQKKGKWIKKKSMIYCPNCYNGFEAIFIRDYNFCPNCGADMRGD